MTINQFRYFLEVAEQLNYSKAAQNLYMTQPALGRQINALEKALNMQLFYRNTRSVKLTPAGRYLYGQLKQQRQIFEEIIETAQKINEGYSGTLSLGILEGLDLGEFLAEIITFFEKAYPNIKLHMKQYSFGELREKLLSGEVDGIVTYSFDIMNLNSVCYRNLHHYKPCWAVPVSNPLSQKETITVADLKNEAFILTSSQDSPQGYEILANLCKEAGFTPKVTFVESLEETILRLETGDKCSLINDSLRIAKSPFIKVFPFEDAYDLGYFAFGWSKNNANMSLKLFTDILIQPN